MKVSIIIPTKNNADILERCLESIHNLDYPKDEVEVIIVDGHSTDGTVEIAKKYRCRVVYEDVGTIGGARNIGVEHSRGDYIVIVFTDADCVADRDWLKNLIREFKDESVASVGGPNITPRDDTEFAKRVGVVLEFLSKPGPRYVFSADKIVEIHHNPTCNSAYRKAILQEVGGFNPRLITCDDEELDYRIRKRGYKILFTPYAKVYHYKRPTWKRFAKMAWNYGVGRRQVIKHERNMGKGAAIQSLFKRVREEVADIIVTLDADGRHDPNEIPLLINTMIETGADIVIRSRFLSKETMNKVPTSRRVGNKILNIVTSVKDVIDTQSGFRAHSRRVIESIRPTEMGFAVDSEILYKTSELGLKIVEVPVGVEYRVPRASKRGPVLHALDVLLGMVKTPLHETSIALLWPARCNLFSDSFDIRINTYSPV